MKVYEVKKNNDCYDTGTENFSGLTAGGPINNKVGLATSVHTQVTFSTTISVEILVDDDRSNKNMTNSVTNEKERTVSPCPCSIGRLNGHIKKLKRLSLIPDANSHQNNDVTKHLGFKRVGQSKKNRSSERVTKKQYFLTLPWFKRSM